MRAVFYYRKQRGEHILRVASTYQKCLRQMGLK